MVEATDIFTLVLRIITVVIILVVFIELIYAFSVVVHTNEADKVIVELSENIMSSQYQIDGQTLTSSRAVFDQEIIKKIAIENEYIEPVRHCKYGAHYEFYDLEKNQKIAEFGHSSSGLSGPRPVKKSFYIGIKKTDEHDQRVVVPGKVDITVSDTYLTKITCMIETAWKTTTIQTIILEKEDVLAGEKIGEAGNTINIYRTSIERENDVFRVILSSSLSESEKRWLPAEIVAQNPMNFRIEDLQQVVRHGKNMEVYFIPIKRDRFEFNGNCVDWTNPGNEGWKPDSDDYRDNNVMICMTYTIVS